VATEWRNRRGKSLWQPTLSDGRRLWRVTLWGEDDGARFGWRGERDDKPALYSRRKAERIERRQARREEREEMEETYEEVRRTERTVPVLYGGR